MKIVRILKNMAAAAIIATVACVAVDARPGRANGSAAYADSPVWQDLEDWRMSQAHHLVAGLVEDTERQCAQGVIANRDNQVARSVPLLERCLSQPDLRYAPGIVAGETLMDSYAKVFDYGAQARVGQELIRRYAADLPEGRRDDIRSDQAMAAVLARAGTRPQTRTGRGPVTLKTATNAMGTIEAELVGNGVPAFWMIDTGANYSVLTESLAKRMGVVALNGDVDVNDSREKTSTVKLGVVETLQVGSFTFHHVVAFIVPDDVFRVEIGGKVHRIGAVLGHPVLSNLGRVTFDAKGSVTGDPDAPRLTRGGRMYMRNLTPLLETTTIGRTAFFGVDTGANVTILFAPFARAMQDGLVALHKESRQTVGVSSSGTEAEAILPQLRLLIGQDHVTIDRVSVKPERGKGEPRFGNVGLDLWKGRPSMTIDYRSMRFELGSPQRSAGRRAGH